MARQEKPSPDCKPMLFAGIVLGELQSAGRPLTGLQIRDRLAGWGRPVRPSQVYRTLAQLKEEGAVLHIRSTSSYMPQPSEPSIILICRTCGDHQLVRAGDAPERCAEPARLAKFDAQRLILEITGRCRECDGPRGKEAWTGGPLNGPDHSP